jgi:hypothetical protein
MSAVNDGTSHPQRTGLVFVSYSQADREKAYELVADLETRGLRCWIAPRDITPAAEWAAEIISAISAARVMVLVFSRASNDSPQVRREVERAVHKRLPVIAFRIEDVLPERSLEYFLSAQHWVDAFPAPRAHYYASLYQHLRRAEVAEVASVPLAASWNEADLQALERGLQFYLGPIAGLLVKRAASRAGSLADLRLNLADELATERERREFLARVS